MNDKEKLEFLLKHHYTTDGYWEKHHEDCMIESDGRKWFSDELYDIVLDSEVGGLKGRVEELNEELKRMRKSFKVKTTVLGVSTLVMFILNIVLLFKH